MSKSKAKRLSTQVGSSPEWDHEAHMAQTFEEYCMKEGQEAIGRIHERLAKLAALPEAVRKMTLAEAQKVGIYISPTGPF